MVKTKPFFVNPYSGIVGKKVEKISNDYGITFLDIDSKQQANINRPGYIIYGDERIAIEGEKENVARFVQLASTPKKNLEQELS